MISADNAHAIHPAHSEYADGNEFPVLNGGVVIKYNAAQKYTTDGLSGAVFSRLCELAAPCGLTCDLEFMPWTQVPDLAAAKDVVRRAGCPNGGILVDALHFARSRSRLEDLDNVPRAWLHYAQLCDAPGEIPPDTAGLIHTARCARLLPGEGGIDLAGLFRRLPADLPVSLEIPNDARLNMIGAEAWSREVLATGRAFCAGLGRA